MSRDLLLAFASGVALSAGIALMATAIVMYRRNRRPADDRPGKRTGAAGNGPDRPAEYRRGQQKATAECTPTVVWKRGTPKPPPAATFPERPVGVPRHHIEASPLARRWEQ